MKCIRILLLGCLCVLHSATAVGLVDSNDFRIANNEYKVSGSDPYLVFDLSSTIVDFVATTGELEFKLQINNAELPISAEVFFGQRGQDEFDPFNRIKFVLSQTSEGGFKLQVPESHRINEQSLFRLDLNRCRQCVLSAANKLSSAIKADITHVLSGLNQLDPLGQKIALDTWRANDLEQHDGIYSFSGSDPFLVSPELDMDTTDLAGVLFELESFGNHNAIHDFQLFYSSEKHGFIEPASSIFRVQDKAGQVSFFVPLDFLNKQFPPVQLLNKLRLDFATHSVKPGDDAVTQWRIKSVMLVHKNQSDSISHLIPRGMYHFKRQKQSKSQIIASIWSKLWSDWLFMMVWLTLLGLCVSITYKIFSKD